MNRIVPLDVIATVDQAKYSPAEMVAALLLNTKKRFVVHIHYRHKDGVKKSTKPAHSIPKNIDLDDMTRIYISALLRHSTRRVSTGTNPEPEPETEAPRPQVTLGQ